MSKIQVNKLYTLTGHNDSIFALVEGNDPRFFYTGAGDGMVVQWDLANPKDGKLIAKLPNSVYALEVDSLRGLLYIGHNFEGIHVIDLDTNKEIWSLKITDAAIFDIKAYEGRLYVGTGDGVITVLDIEERSLLKHIKLGEESIRVLDVDSERGHLAVGASDNTVKVLDLETYAPISRMEGHTNSVFALRYSPDRKLLVSGGRDAHLKIWDTGDYRQVEDIVAHMYAINYLAFREDGKYFVTCSMDKSIKLWETETFQLRKVIDKSRHAGHGTSVNKVIWSRYSQQVVAVSDDRTVSIWDIALDEKI
ncbi:WD40 repeat domain-containing protein [Echinicola vietnamensis]|uniref:WD40 repeat-containing protein n=1 Tax=Echinicola vietnamensis (strain DSM 17526 / LMG 23754 / KMM 6221) TaxID=926556 RepID=L0FUG8_ECHVK|nr:WD40 repeat domain-containing protein [Echinicola vietnamensis]AGA76406.1 WD40 repeat-containing protein [Echinicola vietnamensis DSM 17526]